MLKYVSVEETFSEVPDEWCLTISLSGCKIHCPDCHSKHLWEDIGEELKPVVLSSLLAQHQGVTCVCILGGEDHEALNELFSWVKNNTELKTCWYTGESDIPKDIMLCKLDYIKIGPYRKDLGGLDSPTTNQVLLKVIKFPGYITYVDITHKFQKNNED